MSSNSGNNSRDITVAHSPDSDDAFMFYGMATNKIRVPGVKFSHTLCDIETLNRKAMDGFYDITAISFHAYPYIQDKYAIMPSGGSVGEGYGPMIVASRNIPLDEITRCKIAVPGTMTTAYLALKLFAPDIATETVPFDQIIPKVLEGKYEAGLIIHEGPAHLQSRGPAPHPGHGQVVARRNRTSSAVGRQRHSSVARPRDDQCLLRRTARQHSIRSR